MTISEGTRGVLYILAAAFFFGSAAPLTKLLLMNIAPVTLASLLYMGSGIFFAAFWLVRKTFFTENHTREAPVERRDLPWIAGSVLSGSVLATLVLMVSLQYTSAATAAVLLGFEAVATTMVAALVFHEPVGRRVWLALTCITASCLILAWDPTSPLGFSVGALGVILTCFLWGTDTNISRNVSGKDPIQLVAIKGLSGGVTLTAITLVLGQPYPDLPLIFAGMAVGILGFGGIMTICFLRSLRVLGAARAGAIFSTNPVFGVIVSLLIFRELPEAGFIIAFIFMATGTWLLVSEKHSHRHTHDALRHSHRHTHDDLHHDDHIHGPEAPPVNKEGYHSHPHWHKPTEHEHPHRPDLHHRHKH
ncbi:DMT family transporter [Methanogenium organophilum]|uniref:DMT family transporter n=1 Tax=Methanogenium organophilum TaxID=2199 RepID=A0A9X9S5F7_METOG|nr:DMT family transporter [Methanogenium organophilum]WAI02444.1 DMT family transporter [Methanogenium organophilum]